jgi:hypothetical protein
MACPLRARSAGQGREITVPEHPPACCTQQTITAGPDVAPKTRQKHDYPSAAWRTSYRRRTAAERLNAAIKDTATGSIDRGWIPRMGITPLRAAGAALVHDLHPADRGPHGTYHGAIIANGCLYCPATPTALLQLNPLPPGATAAGTAAHDQQTAELALTRGRYQARMAVVIEPPTA